MAPGRGERFFGYGVMGLPFASGYVLGLRRFTASSIGPGNTAIWLRRPQGAWSMWINTEPMKACRATSEASRSGSSRHPSRSRGRTRSD
jgi:hypothetical protein